MYPTADLIEPEKRLYNTGVSFPDEVTDPVEITNFKEFFQYYTGHHYSLIA